MRAREETYTGYRGPAPKPTATVKREGDRGHRPANEREPKPKQVPPRCPKHLDKGAQQVWRQLVPKLMEMEVLTEVDGMALANLCQAYSTMVHAQETLNEKGYLYKAPSGYIMQSPYVAIVNSCVDKITKLSREFGLAPASRSRIVSNGMTDYERAGAEIERLMCEDLPYDISAELPKYPARVTTKVAGEGNEH